MAKYSDLLRDPRWQKKRLEILQRDNFTCQHCKDTETELHVHHESYKGKPWDIGSDKLVTLCKDCHFITESFGSTFDGCTKIKTVHGYSVVHRNELGYILYHFEHGTYKFCKSYTKELIESLIEFHHQQLTNG